MAALLDWLPARRARSKELARFRARRDANAVAARARLGEPLRFAYGASAIERLDVYRAPQAGAPVFVFFHGGGWISGDAAGAGAYAEPFVARGATFIAPDFSPVDRAGGDLNVLAEQVRRAVAWVWNNAATFGADRDRLYVGGHSSGAHLCSLALVTDWIPRGLQPDAIKGGICMSGMFELAAFRRSARRRYVRFTDTVVEELSPLRHVERLRAPVVVTYGTDELPDFQNQSRAFAAAIERAGKAVELIAATGYDHFEMGESLANPYGPNGRAALAMMGVDRA